MSQANLPAADLMLYANLASEIQAIESKASEDCRRAIENCQAKVAQAAHVAKTE
jgi:hypothetical protein